MNKVLTGLAALVVGAVGLIMYKSNNEEDVTVFEDKNVKPDFMKSFSGGEDIAIVKSHITKSINKLTKKYGNFKIGKSGSPDDRNKQHKNFKYLYPLVESSNEDFIEELEAYYNEKYLEHNKNMNIKKGSASEMTGKTGKYYLYVVAKSVKK